MGSLMAGWNSPALRSKQDRTFSLTRLEIERYWQTRRLIEQLCALAEGAWARKQGLIVDDDEEAPENLGEAEEKEHKNSRKLDWWTRSSHAFLNQPPLGSGSMEGSSFAGSTVKYRYEPQYHVANAAEYFLRSVL